MYKPHEDEHAWANAQMVAARTPQVIQTAVGRLLDVWWTMNHTDQTSTDTLDVFCRLALNESILPEREGELWTPMKPGAVNIRDRVKVRAAHYDGEVGRFHNGRLGVVIAIRGGDIIVKYDDGKVPPFDGVHHSPHALDKRIR